MRSKKITTVPTVKWNVTESYSDKRGKARADRYIGRADINNRH